VCCQQREAHQSLRRGRATYPNQTNPPPVDLIPLGEISANNSPSATFSYNMCGRHGPVWQKDGANRLRIRRRRILVELGGGVMFFYLDKEERSTRISGGAALLALALELLLRHCSLCIGPALSIKGAVWMALDTAGRCLFVYYTCCYSCHTRPLTTSAH
jgi:hypothetical protein